MSEVLFCLLNPINLLDILLVAFLLYKLMMLIKGTRAVQLIRGLLVLLMATAISDILGLKSINWILERAQTALFIAIPIVFQPELRRALEQLGRGNLISRSMRSNFLEQDELETIISEIVRAVKKLAREKTGALIILERQTGLADYVETGIKLDSLVSGEMLLNIFIDKTPLHDGAVIIHRERILAASCFLPLSENPNLSKELGTRHRAGLGITEVSDAIGIIVSEETGVISEAEDGRLTRYLDDVTLKELLLNRLKPQEKLSQSFWHWRG